MTEVHPESPPAPSAGARPVPSQGAASADCAADAERPPQLDPLAQWVRDAAAGDEQAWNLIVERFSALVWSITRSFRLTDADAADVFQLTWLRLLERLGEIREPSRLAGWLATTCRRECQALLRRARRVTMVSGEGFLERAGGTSQAADTTVLATAEGAVLWAAFDQLPPRCQQVLRLLVTEAEDGPPSYQAVARVLEMPVGSLGPTRARCLERLRKLLDTGYPDFGP